MRSVWCVLLFCSVVVGSVSGQSRRDAEGGCAAVGNTFGPLRCPNGSGCGTYSTVQTEVCTIDNEEFCDLLIPVAVCCGKYPTLEDTGAQCLLAEFRDKQKRSQILELASEYDILVPTCVGAYVPAKIALREHMERNNGGL